MSQCATLANPPVCDRLASMIYRRGVAMQRIGRSDEVGTAVDGWVHRRLGECAGQRTEKVIPTTIDTRRYVALEHFAQGRPAILGWSSAGSATSAKTVFFAGDVLFGKLRPNLKKAAAARFDGVCSTDILPLFGKDGLDSAYLLQLAQWDRFQQHAVATASGTKMPRTSWKQLGEFTFLCPPLNEQRTIAAVLSSVDDAIEKTQAVIDQVQVVKRGVMQELLSRGLPGQHTRLKQTEIGMVPSGWSIASLSGLATINPEQIGIGTDPDYLFEYLDIAAIERPGLIGDSQKLRFADAPSRARRKVCRGDILVSTVRPYLRNFACVREDNDNLVVSTGYAVVRPGYGVDGRFLYQHILSAGFVEHLKTRMTGSNYPAVAARDVGSYRLSLPPLAEQRKIAAVLSSMDDAIEKLSQSSDRMQIVKRGLLSALLTGEVRVSMDTEAA